MAGKPTQPSGSQMRFSTQELSLIKNTFQGNEELLKLMRKVFLPELDPTAPLGQMIDLWMTIPVKELTPEQAYENILARNQLIMHIDQQLLQLKSLSEMEIKTPEQVAEELKQNSNK